MGGGVQPDVGYDHLWRQECVLTFTPVPMQALIAEHRKDALLESQARAVEYGQMFGYDQLRPQLLEHMPPLDAAAYARSAAAAGRLDAAPAELVRAAALDFTG